jgi:hypothetical protein
MNQPERTADQRAPDAGNKRQVAAADLERLADRVYRLMQAEIRLEQARGAGITRPKKK